MPLQHKNDFQRGRHCLFPPPPPIFSAASAVLLFIEIVNSAFLRGHMSFFRGMVVCLHNDGVDKEDAKARLLAPVLGCTPSLPLEVNLSSSEESDFFWTTEKMMLSKKCLASCLCEFILWALRQMQREPHFVVCTH